MIQRDSQSDLVRWKAEILQQILEETMNWTPERLESDMIRCLRMGRVLHNCIIKEYYLGRLEIIMNLLISTRGVRRESSCSNASSYSPNKLKELNIRMPNMLSIPIPLETENAIRTMLENIARDVIRATAESETKSKDFMTIKETCHYLNVSYGTVRKWIDAEGLKQITLDGKKFISRQTLIKWLHEHEH